MKHTLPPALQAETRDWHDDDHGRVHYYCDLTQAGRPLLLLHSINAAPSAIEVLPLFEHFRAKRPVYAPDLPGFGRSERSERAYTTAFYTRTLTDFVEHVIGEDCDVIALSTSAEFATGAALQTPLIRSLVLISPTGLMRRALPGPETQQKVHRALRKPWLGRPLFRTLTLKPVIARYIHMNFNERGPQQLIDYAARSARQPGAQHAPLYFLSFQLFSANAVETLYARVQVPALVLYDRDPNLSFERLPELLGECPNWQAVRIQPSLGLPHWEHPQRTTAAIEAFWG